MTDLLYLASIGGFVAATHWYVSAIATFAWADDVAPPPPTTDSLADHGKAGERR